MSKKSHRLGVIKNLITSQTVSSQEELLVKLRQAGIEATQSTLSRDIKELGAVKMPHPENGYIYMMPNSLQGDINGERIPSLVTDNIVGIAFSGNIMVIKTMPGYANAIAVLIDNSDYSFIVGTIAGDDSIFIVLAEDTDRGMIKEYFSHAYPKLTDMIG